MKKPPLPEHGIALTTYAELEEYVRAFAAGFINLLIVIGDGGLQKTRTASFVLPEDCCWIQGNASPFGIYLKLFHYREKLVVIDDVDSLYRNKDGINLLKCLCQTEATKTVSWQSASKQLEKEKVPREFVTSSRVILIVNDWLTLNKNVAAIEDRRHVVRFAPTASVIHQRTKDWFNDDESHEWIGDRLDRIMKPSMRLYYRAQELKRAKMDWKRLILIEPEDPRRRLVLDLHQEDSFETVEQRAQEFVARRGGCRATYFNHVKRLRESGHLPPPAITAPVGN